MTTEQKRIDGIIFDVDGTLLDSMEMWRNLDYEFLEGMGITPDSDYTEAVNKMTLKEGVAYTKERYHLPMSEEDILETIRGMAKEFYYNRAELKPWVKEFLEILSLKNIPMTIATSSQKDFISHALERNGVARFFSGIFSGSDLGINKTKPDLFLMAAESIGAEPEYTWVFEDSYHALETAKRAGFKTAAVYDQSNESFLEATIREADLYLNDLSSMAVFLNTAGI